MINSKQNQNCCPTFSVNDSYEIIAEIYYHLYKYHKGDNKFTTIDEYQFIKNKIRIKYEQSIAIIDEKILELMREKQNIQTKYENDLISIRESMF